MAALQGPAAPKQYTNIQSYMQDVNAYKAGTGYRPNPVEGNKFVPYSQVLSEQAPTPSSGGGGGGGNMDINALFKQQTGGDIAPVGWQPQNDAAQAAYDAELSSANSALDYQREQLLSQIPSLEGQRDRAVSDLDLGLSGVTNQVGTSKANAQTNTDQQVRQAGSIAKSTTQQNRNVLRALGIINSSAAGELLSKPTNEFGQQRAQLQQQLGQRMGELDDFMNQKVAEANSAKQGIISQFTDLYGKIQSDLRFNDRQRTDAIKAATASLQQRLADIQTSVMNYNQQVELQKREFTNGLAQIAAYNDPTIAKDYLSSMTLTTPQNQQQQIGIYTNPTDQKKKQGTLSGYSN